MSEPSYLDIIKNYGETPTRSNFSSYTETNFEVVDVLGSGGFGVVYEVSDKFTKRNYALKRIKIDYDKGVDYALREMLALQSMDHPHIVKYIDSWVERTPSDYCYEQSRTCDCATVGFKYQRHHARCCRCCFPIPDGIKIFFYIQMELCDFPCLGQWLYMTASNRDKQVALKIFKQIVDAVAYIHSKNFIHRDLKPCNIFFSAEETIKIGDFGLVTSINNTTTDEETGDLIAQSYTTGVGTKYYMSPELSSSNSYDYKVDIYSLGVILYELLIPFPNLRAKSKALRQLCRGRYDKTFLRNHRQEGRAVKRMTSPNPNIRPTILEVQSLFD